MNICKYSQLKSFGDSYRWLLDLGTAAYQIATLTNVKSKSGNADASTGTKCATHSEAIAAGCTHTYHTTSNRLVRYDKLGAGSFKICALTSYPSEEYPDTNYKVNIIYGGTTYARSGYIATAWPTSGSSNTTSTTYNKFLHMTGSYASSGNKIYYYTNGTFTYSFVALGTISKTAIQVTTKAPYQLTSYTPSGSSTSLLRVYNNTSAQHTYTITHAVVNGSGITVSTNDITVTVAANSYTDTTHPWGLVGGMTHQYTMKSVA